MTMNPLEIFHAEDMRSLCAELTALGYEKATQKIQKLNLPPETRASLLTQVQLRQQAKTKFGERATELFLTRDGLEQATRHQVAALHAQRFQHAKATHVADLGCGNGADALAFTDAGMRVSAWDLDEIAYTAATLNLPQPSQAFLGNVLDLQIKDLAAQGIDAVFADPARRTGAGRGNQRVAAPEDWSPSLPHVLGWRPQLREHVGVERLGVKLAPGIDYEYLPADMEAQWVSVDGTLVEASLWSPACALNGAGRRAVIFRSGWENPKEFFLPGNPSASPTPISEGANLKRYLWEADAAVIRAGVLENLAHAGNAEAISENIAYLTTDAQLPEEWDGAVSVFEIIEVTKLKPKAVIASLKALQATNIEVKKRGADISPNQWQRDLLKVLKLKKTSLENPLVVFATRVNREHTAIIARRI